MILTDRSFNPHIDNSDG